MNPKRFLIIFLLMSLLMVGMWLPSNATPVMAQVQYATPTPGPDGRILYTAQEGDNCGRISLLNGISVQTFMQLNSGIVNKDCTNIIPGQQYLIGLAGAAAGTPTAGPSPTPLPPTITPTPFTGTTEICVLLFEDQNGDAIRQETEPAIAGGAVSVTERNGEYSASRQTEINPDTEAFPGICFTDVPEGTYNITVGVPDNYNATMDLNYSLEVKAGDRAFVGFGAQSQAVVVSESQTPNEGRSPILGIVGALLLVGGGVLGYFAWRSGKPESKLSGGSGILRK